jgi:hypothetical protein
LRPARLARAGHFAGADIIRPNNDAVYFVERAGNTRPYRKIPVTFPEKFRLNG